MPPPSEIGRFSVKTSIKPIPPRSIGYVRSSNGLQGQSAQATALEHAGCEVFYFEPLTENWRNRPQLTVMLDSLAQGEVVTVTSLDRIARSTRRLLEITGQIHAAGAYLRSLAEPWLDTTALNAQALLNVFAGIVEFERALILERTGHGRDAAMTQGVKFGAKPLPSEQIEQAIRMIAAEGCSVSTAADRLGIHRSTLYRKLGELKTDKAT